MDNDISRMETQEDSRSDHLPKPGYSLLWLLLFTVLYFAGAILYFTGYGAFLGVRHANMIGTPEFQEIVQESAAQHAKSATGLSGMYLVQFVLLFPAVLWASQFKTQHLKETLGFRKFTLKSLRKWLLILVGFLLVEGLIGSIFKIDAGAFMNEMSGSKNMFLVFTFIILAPLLEETVFRGYLFKAWRYTRLGLSGTLLATSVLFVLLHWGQYGLVHIVFLFIFSVLLGLARERSGSLWMPIILHSANNLLPVIIVVYLGIV